MEKPAFCALLLKMDVWRWVLKTGKTISCLIHAGSWLVINCLLLENVCKQLPLKRCAGQAQEIGTPV